MLLLQSLVLASFFLRDLGPQVKDLIDKLDKNAAWVLRARSSKDVSPQIAANIKSLKPAEGRAQVLHHLECV
jgi:hypothetical protein